MRQSMGWLGVGVLCLSGTALASTELPVAFDGRTVGMGGTGVASVDNPSALMYNPAQLDSIEKLAITVGGAPLVTQLAVPLAGPDSSVKSSGGPAPTFFAGAGYRVHERVVLGLGVYPVAGGGAAYEDVAAFGGVDPTASMMLLEGSLAASFRITDQLSVAAGPRLTFAQQSVTQPVPLAPGVVGTSEASMSGLSFLGATVGVLYKPTDTLRFGLNYRSKVTVDAEGDVTLKTPMGDQEGTIATSVSTPHMVRAGGSLALLEKTLTFAADFTYMLFSESNKKSTITINLPSGEQETVTNDNWRNTFAAHVGAEYAITKMIPVRLGYAFTQMATPPKSASPFGTPPGEIHSIHGGVGLRLDGGYDVDLGGYYMLGGADVSASDNPAAGRYEATGYLIALSGTMRL